MGLAVLTPEAVMVAVNRDARPPQPFGRWLWCSRRMVKRCDARKLAALASKRCRAACPKFKAVRDGAFWRGVVYAGRRSKREK